MAPLKRRVIERVLRLFAKLVDIEHGTFGTEQIVGHLEVAIGKDTRFFHANSAQILRDKTARDNIGGRLEQVVI